jgi:hypothetical protein
MVGDQARQEAIVSHSRATRLGWWLSSGLRDRYRPRRGLSPMGAFVWLAITTTFVLLVALLSMR